jgi:DNA-binding NarL/FixJ family response regulator
VTAPIKVLIADDHAIVRNGLKMLLEQEDDIVVAGEAADGLQAVEEARRLSPDVVLMDLTMPELGGIEATGLLRESSPDAKVLILTSIAEDSQVLDGSDHAGARRDRSDRAAA